MNELIVIAIAMLPLIELRGAIPIGVGLGLSLWYTYLLALIANLIIIPILIYLCPIILEIMRKSKIRLIHKITNYINEKGEKLKSKIIKHENGVFIALMTFVAIPLPGTGVWSGCLAAIFLKLDKKKSCIFTTLGLFLASIIVYLLTLVGINIIK